MNQLKKVVILVLSLSALSACSDLNKSDVGTLTGGVIGGLVGSQFGGGSGQLAATAAGSIVGAMIGEKIGETMDRQDKMMMQQALETSSTGHTTSWTNPDNGNKYSVKPTNTYYQQSGEAKSPCREYVTTVIIDGKAEKVYGKACRSSNGQWHATA